MDVIVCGQRVESAQRDSIDENRKSITGKQIMMANQDQARSSTRSFKGKTYLGILEMNQVELDGELNILRSSRERRQEALQADKEKSCLSVI